MPWREGYMLVIPAIDVKDGRCVRLRQGDFQAETVYSEDPVTTARQWEQRGARRLHVVDLNGAVDGQPRNLPQIRAIVQAVGIPVQVGGGIRTRDTLRGYCDLGAVRVVLGTVALTDRAFLETACRKYPGRILLGLDARDGRVAVKGWRNLSETTAVDLLHALASLPLAGVIYTDIARDGMLAGPNLVALADIVASSPFPVIASGGITRLEDLQRIRALGSRVEGAIVGKALYDGQLDLAAAIAAAA
ncbi:MAG: 1-(5-phosphoribosyl)-5-[(5-phosphoribosylamino)methylideneamino]imidazole-4-carboxamide isomerase [Nitrospirales bacterium]